MEPRRNVMVSFEFPLVYLGFANSLAARFGLSKHGFQVRLRRILLLIGITWMPLLLLTMFSGHALQGVVEIPLLHDPAVCARFLFVLPLLELAEAMVAVSLPIQARHFVESQLVADSDRARFDSAVDEVIRARSIASVECLIAIFALVLSLTIRTVVLRDSNSSWEIQGSTRTLAGWWYALVSLPIMFFFFLRWLWIFLLWGLFLFRVSRLELKLTPTHPDHAGGLGFLGWGLASFSLVLMAIASMFSSGFFYQILHKKETLDSLKYHVLVFIVLALAFLYAPLLVFVGQLSRCRFKGLLDFSSLVLQYDRRFEEKWVEKKDGEPMEPMLLSADIQSLANLSSAYGHVNDMRLVPFDMKGFAVLVAAALFPMLPLVGTAIPLNEILAKLGELLF